MDILVSVLSFVLVSLISGNSLAVTSGAIISSRIVRRNTGIIIAIAGYISGLVLQGNLLDMSFHTLLPLSSSSTVAIALLVSTTIFIIGYRLRVPQSLSITFAMTLIGIAIASGISINAGFVSLMLLFWISAPLIAVGVTMLLLGAAEKRMRKARIWPALRKIRVMLMLVSFLSAMVMGANGMGLLYSSVKSYTSVWVVMAGIVAGSFLLSSGSLRRLGEQILPIRYLNALVTQSISVVLVEIATLGSLPFSNTQAFTASLYGAALSYKTKLLIRKNTLTIVFSWIITAAISLLLGYALAVLV